MQPSVDIRIFVKACVDDFVEKTGSIPSRGDVSDLTVGRLMLHGFFQQAAESFSPDGVFREQKEGDLFWGMQDDLFWGLSNGKLFVKVTPRAKEGVLLLSVSWRRADGTEEQLTREYPFTRGEIYRAVYTHNNAVKEQA
jgi:hypothetical protein